MGMYCTLTELSAADVTALEAGREPGRVTELSLEKAWHGLDELLRRARPDDPAAGFLLAGGRPVGPDGGYGPGRVFGPDELPALAAMLNSLSRGELWSHYDAADFESEGIYPLIWDEDEAGLKDEYTGYFRGLKEFVAAVASRGHWLGVVIA